MLVEVERHFRALRPALGLRKVFMEIAAERCALAHRVAGYVERAYAVHLSREAAPAPRAGNVVPLRCCDGAAIPVPAGSVDVAFSQELMARELRGIHRALAPGGRYVCTQFGRSRDLTARLLAAGFRKVRFYASAGGFSVRIPGFLLRALEPARALPSLRLEALK